MKRYEVLLLISMMIEKGKGIKVYLDEHHFRLERLNEYDIWHDETDSKASLIVYEADVEVLDVWLKEICQDVKYSQHNFEH